MRHCAHATSLRLKAAGLPQPDPKPGQMWYGKRTAGFEAEPGSLCILIGTETGNLEFVSVDGTNNECNRFFVFAPSLEDITANFPPGEWSLDMWDGRHSCKFDNGETTIRTQADNFSEAAALVYLAQNEKL